MNFFYKKEFGKQHKIKTLNIKISDRRNYMEVLAFEPLEVTIPFIIYRHSIGLAYTIYHDFLGKNGGDWFFK